MALHRKWRRGGSQFAVSHSARMIGGGRKLKIGQMCFTMMAPIVSSSLQPYMYISGIIKDEVSEMTCSPLAPSIALESNMAPPATCSRIASPVPEPAPASQNFVFPRVTPLEVRFQIVILSAGPHRTVVITLKSQSVITPSIIRCSAKIVFVICAGLID